MEYEMYNMDPHDHLLALVYKTKRRIERGKELTISYYPEDIFVS
jgi:hypothetical protein